MAEPIATSLAELTILRMQPGASRRAWDWVVGKYLRAWERKNANYYSATKGKHLLNGEFGWYHWEAILTRAWEIVNDHDGGKAERAVSENTVEALTDYARWVDQIVGRECQKEFETLRSTLLKHGLLLTSFDVNEEAIENGGETGWED
jgi:hypothetical protein